jgi:hypothetical protein
MSNGVYDELQQLLQSGTVPSDVTDRLILAAITETLKEVRQINDTASGLARTVNELDQRIKALERVGHESPSVLWLIKNNPKTIPTLLFIMVLVLAVDSVARPLLFHLAGIPVP